MSKHYYEVIVGNVGTVYDGTSKAKATKTYNSYVKSSKAGGGRDSGESVTMMCDSEPCREYIGPQSLQENGERWNIHTLDVWGNAKEGYYDINQVYETNRTVSLPENPTKQSVIDALVYVGEIDKPNSKKMKHIDVEINEEDIYIRYKGKPILTLAKRD